MMHVQRGFTLLELMVTLLILAITITLGVPTLLSTVTNNRLTSQANSLILSLNTARSESIKRSRLVAVRRSNASWRDGWDVYVDENGNQQFDLTEVVIQTNEPINTGYTINPDAVFAEQVIYRPDGRSSASGNFFICGPARAADFRRVVISDTGRLLTDENGVFAQVCP